MFFAKNTTNFRLFSKKYQITFSFNGESFLNTFKATSVFDALLKRAMQIIVLEAVFDNEIDKKKHQKLVN